MKEFFKILFSFDLKNIFHTPTKNPFLQFFRYGFVGAVATVFDWCVFYVLTKLGLFYMLSGVIAFVTGLSVNFLLSKRFVFSAEKTDFSSKTEFITYAVIGILGLLITEAIMYVMITKLKLYFMIPKIIATGVVFVWNFVARKAVLYRG